MRNNKNKTSSMADGLNLAAIHGYRPHTLGLCGPSEARRQKLLKKFLQGQIAPSKMKKVFKQFMGAYAYYKLIAKSNNIKNTFDKRVIEAYWMGNRLLDKVKIDNLRQMIARDFADPELLSKAIATKKANLVTAGSKPHHSFHVLTIGSVTGSVDFTNNTNLKDICRVSWGMVTNLKNKKGKGETEKITVYYQPLIGKKIIKLGQPIKKVIHWARLIAPEVKKGDYVSFHWDWLVKVLNNKELANLKKYTQNTLNSLYAKY